MKTPLVFFGLGRNLKTSLRTDDLPNLLVGLFWKINGFFIVILRYLDTHPRVGELPFFGCPVGDLERAYGSQDTCFVLE